MKKIILIILLYFISISIFAQSIPSQGKLMNWIGVGISKKIGNKISIEYYHTYSFEINNKLQPNFIQSSVKLQYKISDLSVYLGTKPTFILTNSSQSVVHRLISGIKYKFRFSKKIRSKVSLNFEHYFTQKSKFKQRYFFRFDIYYRNPKWPLKLRPFLNQKIYYYSGGRPLQYYDDLGDKTENVPPNGYHAYRWRGGLKIYPTKKMSISIYMEQQREFNLNILGNNDINSLNPNSGKIRRGFHNYSTIGISTYLNL